MASTVTDRLTRDECIEAIRDWRTQQLQLDPDDHAEYMKINDVINNWLGLLQDL